jgi:putative zinc finger protein
MRTLNCKRTARMISLYLAGDLVGAPEREVAAHLAACDGCRRLADEFSQSRSLLTQACAPPEFGAEFYSGIRHAVLGEIASNQILAKPSLLRPRWLYATAFAAMVIVSVVMLQHFVSTRRQPPRDVARAPRVIDQATPSSSEVPLPRKKHELTGKQSVLAPASPHGRSRHFAEMEQPDALVAQAPRVGGAQIEPAMQSSTSLGPVALETSSQISRIEIQTADPNIRIIWLSPRESREPDGSNHDQDHPETSNRK